MLGKSRIGWRERIGILSSKIDPRGKPCLWVHAVSAGEVVAAVPILRELRVRLPKHYIALSVITPAGREMAAQQAADLVDAIFYAPYDLILPLSSVIKRLQPVAYISLESEMWPNTLHLLKRCGCATLLVNARVSDKNYSRASTVGKLLFRWMLGNMDQVAAQSCSDKERFGSLGASNVTIVGNSKFDQSLIPLEPDAIITLRDSLGLPVNSRVLVAGSTRSAEEERVLLSAYGSLKKEFNDLCLVIAPRQIERSADVVKMLESHGYAVRLKTQQNVTPILTDVLVMDTMGELANLYAVATIAFVGNSFQPVVKGGGQNILQPLAHGKPVIVGPQTATIRSELAQAKAEGVAYTANSADEISAIIQLFLNSTVELARISEKALQLMARNRGVSAKYADLIVAAIPKEMKR